MAARVPIFVCGEPTRGDDAAGFAAVELLPAEIRERVEVVPVGQLDILFLMDLPDDAPCIVVDAIAGLRPGEVWVRPLAALIDRARALDATGRAVEPRSSHELPLEQVLGLAAALRDAPPAGTFVGIGGGCFDVGTPLSAPVTEALPAFAEAITAAITTVMADAITTVVADAITTVVVDAIPAVVADAIPAAITVTTPLETTPC